MSAIQVEGISRSFGGLRALRDVSFEVPKGSIVGVIGPNGAGKTTLFNVVTGNVAPDAGRVSVYDRDVTGFPPHAIARLGVGRTFQLMRPFAHLSVMENLTAAALMQHRRVRDAEEAARRLAERTGLARYAAQAAGGLPTAGKKRLELARSVATGASILLLDEVLAGLVPGERAPVIELLAELRAEGMTLLMVEHVMAAVMRLCDHVVVLHHGERIAEGPPAAVVGDPLVVEAYLGSSHAHH